jgi:hypothetical protein
MYPIAEDTTQVCRAGVERATKEFTARIEPLGIHTKKMLWVRKHQHTADWTSLFVKGSSYGGKPLNYSVSLDVGFGIRVLNDVFDGLAGNGPRFDYSERMRAARYHHRFNAQTWSTFDRCIDDLARYVVHEGEPWFTRFREIEALLAEQGSPLRETGKERLRLAVAGQPDENAIKASLKMLGIKPKREAKR